MRLDRLAISAIFTALLIAFCTTCLLAEDQVEVTTGVDFVNRYIWRGLEFGGAPSIQPTLAVGYAGFELGTWGAYTLSNEATDSDEIDFWCCFTYDFENSMSVTALITDYYFPGSGIEFFNFNNYDDPEGAGAHTLEAGLSVTGPENFPITLSGYVNFHNDEGNNMYFQADFPISLETADLNFFAGLTTGSEDNPDYYGSDDLAFINLGVTASREIKISDDFVLPLFVSYILNPKIEISYVVVGLSL